jgi:hypothetical protein
VKYGDVVHIGSVPFRIDPEVAGEPTAPPSAGMRVSNRAYMRKDTERLPSGDVSSRDAEILSPEQLSANPRLRAGRGRAASATRSSAGRACSGASATNRAGSGCGVVPRLARSHVLGRTRRGASPRLGLRLDIPRTGWKGHSRAMSSTFPRFRANANLIGIKIARAMSQETEMEGFGTALSDYAST